MGWDTISRWRERERRVGRPGRQRQAESAPGVPGEHVEQPQRFKLGKPAAVSERIDGAVGEGLNSGGQLGERVVVAGEVGAERQPVGARVAVVAAALVEAWQVMGSRSAKVTRSSRSVGGLLGSPE